MKDALLVLAALFIQTGGTSSGGPPCQAKLGWAWDHQLLTLTSSCRSSLHEPARYRYQLVVKRQGAGGRSQNAQGGEFALAPQQDAVLSTVRLNVGPDDVYQAKLLVFDLEGNPVAQDSLSQDAFRR